MATTRLYFEHALLPEGWARDVSIEVDAEGWITAVEANAQPSPAGVDGGIAVPGIANLHSHAFQRGMAGLAERRGPGEDGFWTWRETMYRFLDRLTPDDVTAIAAQLYGEMLEAGFTAVAEFHYLHHRPDGSPYADRGAMAAAIAEAAVETGIGLTLLPVFYASGGFGGEPVQGSQLRFYNDLDGFTRLAERVREIARGLPHAAIGTAAHSLRAVTPETLAALVAAEREGPVHIHIAEQRREVEDCVAWCGRRPVTWLFDHHDVDERWCLVHATHMTARETRRLARSGAVAGLCPITEANLGDGIFDGVRFLNAGGASASAPTATCSSAPPRSCGYSSTRSACATGHVIAWSRRAAPPAARSSTAPSPAAARRWAAAPGR
ncbi:MAG: formimidoylglutamate deiminase, partial [Kiloniellales bacterium]